MKKYLLIVVAVVFSIYIFGCRKKEWASEELEEPLSMEALSTMTTSTAVPSQTAPVSQAPLESLPPAGPYKPTNTEIQTALKNAGFYAGEIDGKIGPMTRKATEEFQKANNLKADGKVGLKTWAVLSKYLNLPPASQTPPAKKKR